MTAAAGRRAGGASSHAASSSSSSSRSPSSSAASSCARARGGARRTRRAWPRGSHTGGPWPGQITRSGELAQAPQRRRGSSPRSLGDEHAALAEHRVAGEARAAGHEDEVVGARGRARSGPRAGRSDRRRRAARRRRSGAPPTGGRPSRSRSASSALDVVAVVVRERDPAGAAARLDRGGDRVEVLGERRARDRPPTPGRGRRPTCWCRTACTAPGFSARTRAMSSPSSSLDAQRGTSR